MPNSLDFIPAPVGSSQLTLVDQLVQWGRRRIDERVFRAGMRMPSIRRLALEKGVSRFTVVEAYERLVALGYLDSRRGSGFFVRDRSPAEPLKAATPVESRIDVIWLLRNTLRTSVPEKGPGLGYLPNAWLDGEMLSHGLRALSRQSSATMLRYGQPQGFLPLRQQLQTRLEELEIGAVPEQVLLVTGITHALDLISGVFLRAGDTILVGDPGWFQMFARFAWQGVRVLGVPYTADGLDVDALEALAHLWNPKLFVINSSLQNPTGTSLSAARAFRILQLAERYDFVVVEDDIYGDLCPAGYPATRLASLDQLKRVIYLGSFTKTLAANLRVGYIACDVGFVQQLTDQKMLLTLTSPELNERLVYKVLTDGHYRRHVERLRGRLDGVREAALRMLEARGMKLFCQPDAGMFVWADTGVDSAALTAAAYERGYVLAPGALFSPAQAPSTWMRFNIANCGDPALPGVLDELLAHS